MLMKLLGIDYGRKKIGLAISGGKLAEPYQVIRYADRFKMFAHIQRIVERLKIEKIIIGMSENEMGQEIKKFGEEIKSLNSQIPVEFFDETLSSQDAITMSIASGMGRKRRKEMEDAFAASVMLQHYIDSSNII